MIRIKIFILTLCISSQIFGQASSELSNSQRKQISVIEKRMQSLGTQFLADTVQNNRIKGARDFVKLLVEALKVENSFNYPFDSIPYLSKLTPEDKTFRIFTFQVMLDNYTFVHYGCIQLNRKNIKLIPFKDFSDTFMVTPQITISNRNWLGAVYYKIIPKKINNKPVYFLFGYDQNDLLTDKKYVEAMWLENDSTARFGMPVFEKTTTEVFVPKQPKLGEQPEKVQPPKKTTKTYYRYVLEYRKKAGVNMKYHEDKDMIIHDHTESLDKRYTDVGFMRVPDGSYEGLKWNGKKWIWVEYVKLADKETNAPIRPVPSKDLNKLKTEGK